MELHDRVSPLAREWDLLAERLGASPFLRPEWITAWADAFAPDALTIVVARREGELVGLVPLRRRGGELRSASNEHSPEFGFLAGDSDAAADLARAIYGHGESAVRFDFIDPEDSGLAQCRQIGAWLGYRSAERVRIRSPYLQIEGEWEAYARRIRQKARAEPERRLRRLNETGNALLDIADGSDRLDELLAEGYHLEAAGWKGEKGTAIVARDDTRAFYSGFARAAATRGWLRLAFLRLDGRALAFVFALEVDGVFYTLKSGFDPGFARFGPSGLLRYQLLKRAFADGLRRYEFLGDADPWKLEWTANCHERSVVRTFAPSLRGLLAWSVHAHVLPRARRLPLVAALRSRRRR
ncbi:MAG: GNAT family N-acetyltransferase [Gaiellaceae bacterium]